MPRLIWLLMTTAAFLAVADDSLKYQQSDASPGSLKTSILESGLEKKDLSAWKPGEPMELLDGRVVFDVQERLRFEWRENNFDFDDATDVLTDDAYLLQRFRVGMNVKAASHVEIYLQAQDSREIGSSRPDDPGFFASEGDQHISLHQAFIKLSPDKESPFGMTAGRQEVNYGDQRLVGAFGWNNIGRVFDGGRFRYQQENWNIEMFALMPVQIYNDHFDVPDAGDRFFGVYFQSKQLPCQVTEFYAFYRNKTDIDTGFPTGGSPIGTDAIGPLGGSQRGDYATMGTRMQSNADIFGPWDYNLEMAGQAGSIVANAADTNIPNATTRRQDLLTFAGHAAGGYTCEGEEKVRVGVEYNYASGDGDPTDGTNHSFQNLFPTNHKFYGTMDLFAWRNLHDASTRISAKPIGKLGVVVDYHAFWLATTGDQWFRANGTTPVRNVPARRTADSFVGQEVDLTLSYPLADCIKLLAGYSHFFSGAYVADTGPADDADFAYLQTVVQF